MNTAVVTAVVTATEQFFEIREQGIFPEFMSAKDFGVSSLDSWIDEAQEKFNTLLAEMRKISQATRNVKGRHFCLELHTTTTVGLRWRLSVNNRHATWTDVEPLMAELDSERRSWYLNLAVQSLILNARISAASKELANAKKVKDGRMLKRGQQKNSLIPFFNV